jgi:hypothetical protein
MERRF